MAQLQVQRHVIWQKSTQGQLTCMSTYVPHQHVMSHQKQHTSLFKSAECSQHYTNQLYQKHSRLANLPDRSAFLRDGQSTALHVRCLMYNRWDNNPCMPDSIFANGCSKYTLSKIKATQQNLHCQLSKSKRRPYNGVQRTQKLVSMPPSTWFHTVCCVPDTNIKASKVQCSNSIAAELLPLPVANSSRAKKADFYLLKGGLKRKKGKVNAFQQP